MSVSHEAMSLPVPSPIPTTVLSPENSWGSHAHQTPREHHRHTCPSSLFSSSRLLTLAFSVPWACLHFVTWWTSSYDAYRACSCTVRTFWINFWNVSRSCCFLLKISTVLSLWLECFVSKCLLNFDGFMRSVASDSPNKRQWYLHKPCSSSVHVKACFM